MTYFKIHTISERQCCHGFFSSRLSATLITQYQIKTSYSTKVGLLGQIQGGLINVMICIYADYLQFQYRLKIHDEEELRVMKDDSRVSLGRQGSSEEHL